MIEREYFIVKWPGKNAVVLNYKPDSGKIIGDAFTEGAALKLLEAYECERRRVKNDIVLGVIFITIVVAGAVYGWY